MQIFFIKGLACLRRFSAKAGGVNFTNIVRPAIAPISFCQKNTIVSHKYKKAAQKTFVRKSFS